MKVKKWVSLAVLVFLTTILFTGASEAAFDGIWKNVRPDTPNPTMNYYIQTYTEGSAVVIVTPDLSTFYVFLDENYSDGIDVDSMEGAGHHLAIVFFDQGEGRATLSISGETPESSSSIFKWYGSPVSGGLNGIWKDAELSEGGVVNMFFQNYDTGSAIAIITFDLVRFYTFIDDTFVNDFAAPDLSGSGASLTITFTTPTEAATVLTLPASETGKAQSETLFKWFAAPGATLLPPDGNVVGDLTIPQDSFADEDTNDPFQQGDNDSIPSAQSISIPSTVGGWASGFDEFQFDEDYYGLGLTGQAITITLVVSAPESLNLDLYLVDESGENITPPSTGTGKLEQIVTGNQTGNAYIRVTPAAGAGLSSNYTLVVGQSSSASKSAPIPADAEFVPGEAVVRFKEGYLLQAAIAGQAGFRVKAGAFGAGPLLVTITTVNTGEKKQLSSLDKNRAREETIAAIYLLRARKDLLWAEPNYIRRPAFTPDDSLYARQWHYPLVNLQGAWNTTRGSNQVIVAILDTGVLSGHPDFDPQRFVQDHGYDFISDSVSAGDGDGLDSDPEDPGDKDGSGVSSFHGTHVAGTVGAWTDNGVGVSGVDHRCLLMILRVLGKEGGTDYDIYQAMRYAASLSNDSGSVPEQRADVINMSLGGPGISFLLQRGVNEVRQAGVVVVAAAGNQNQDADNFVPGSLNGVVSVSAVDLNKEKAWYSNFGDSVDVAAPGGDTSVDIDGDGYPDGVLSTLGDDSISGSIRYTYAWYQGTSMATPHVAGVLALMQAAYMAAHDGQRFTPSDFDNWLAGGLLSLDLGVPGHDMVYGYGLLDAAKAVEHASGGGVASPPIPAANPSSLNFSNDKTALLLTVINVGGSDPSGQFNFSVTTDPTTWLSVSKSEGTAGSSTPSDAEVTVTVDRAQVSDGTYTGKVIISADAPAEGDVEVPVIMIKQQAASAQGDVGPVYVLVIDPNSFTTSHQQVVFKKDDYSYAFTSIPAGAYLLAAGTDRNGDGFIDDEGEAFGFFPLSSLPELVVIGNHESTLANFPVNELVDLSDAAASVSEHPAIDTPAGYKRVGASPTGTVQAN
ncbi:MAG: S8 family serine peptidase [Deltaproteobacteria bacterium]|nr:S8 family serine peptidase [Deltaproteobacteria bacterium]